MSSAKSGSSRKSRLAIVVAALCSGAPLAHAQTAPVRYWIPGWPIGFGSSLAPGDGAKAYGDFPSFDFGSAGSGLSYSRVNFPTGFFAASERGAMGWTTSGADRGLLLGPFTSFTHDAALVGYDFQAERGLPLQIYAGISTSRFQTGAGGPFAAFDPLSATLPVYTARAGVAYQPMPNLNLSVEVGYTQQGRVESDGSALSLLGMSPSAFGPRH
ncbi:hypothetical protein [Bradyrhizobium sp. 2TAF24]|uniref:hypothetical protein n=1 Tax=Bradyrhizobium sp. 2TAF24 TaxID=3233011 RepID=UPI003F90FB12